VAEGVAADAPPRNGRLTARRSAAKRSNTITALSGAEIIALVSVVTTGVTALGAPWLSERLQRARFALETRVTREDELRGQLQAAATRLREAIQRLANVEREGAVSAPLAEQTRSSCH
jgi:hypothetical protein